MPFGLDERLVPLVLQGYAGFAVFLVFARLERQGRREIVLAAVLGGLLLQGLLYISDASVPSGPLRPGPLRLGEALLVAAVAARFWAGGFTVERRISMVSLAWGAFLLWYVAAAVTGLFAGHDRTELLFQAKLILHVGGFHLLVSGIPPSRLVRRTSIGRMAAFLGVVVGVQVAVSFFDLDPGPLSVIGPDAGSFYLALAIFLLVGEAVQPHPRTWCFVAAVPLLISGLAVGQRATVVHVAVTGVVLGIVVLTRTARRRLTVRPAEIGLAVAVTVVLALSAVVPGLSRGEPAPPLVEEAVEDTFGGVGNTQSADARVLKWDEGEKLFWDRPVLGWGLGKFFSSFRPGIRGVGVFEESAVFDNAYFDVAVRAGAVGLVLFVVALWVTVAAGLRAWRRHPDGRVAVVGLTAATFVIGYAAKGFVESVNDKVLLSCMLGVMTGSIAASQHVDWAATPFGGRTARGAGQEETNVPWS